MIDLTKKYKRNGVPVEVGVIGGVLISVDEYGDVVKHNSLGLCARDYTNDLTPYNEWEDFKDDEPVMVRDSENRLWVRRYFAGTQDGLPTTYSDGRTKWSNEDSPTPRWNFCRRPTKEELGE